MFVALVGKTTKTNARTPCQLKLSRQDIVSYHEKKILHFWFKMVGLIPKLPKGNGSQHQLNYVALRLQTQESRIFTFQKEWRGVIYSFEGTNFQGKSSINHWQGGYRISKKPLMITWLCMYCSSASYTIGSQGKKKSFFIFSPHLIFRQFATICCSNSFRSLLPSVHTSLPPYSSAINACLYVLEKKKVILLCILTTHGAGSFPKSKKVAGWNSFWFCVLLGPKNHSRVSCDIWGF